MKEGGEATLAKYGREHFSRAGKIGGLKGGKTQGAVAVASGQFARMKNLPQAIEAHHQNGLMWAHKRWHVNGAFSSRAHRWIPPKFNPACPLCVEGDE